MKICCNCGHENSDTSKFCEDCGTKLPLTPEVCPSCKAPLEGTPKFCPDCGFKLVDNTQPVAGTDSYETYDTYDDYDEYDEYDSYSDDSDYETYTPAVVDIEEKKDLIYNAVQKVCKELGKDCVHWTLWNYKNFPEDKKQGLLKISTDINYDDFACIFSIPNALKFQFSAKGDYGLVFMLSGFYIRDSIQLKSFTYVKYQDMKSYTVKKKDFILTLSSSIADILGQTTTEISNSEYDAETLGKLLLELKKIDYENPTESFQVGNSTRSKGLHSARERNVFLKGQESGYIRCSREYEAKLRRQAELFLNTTNKWKRERAEYEALLDDYDQTIVELEEKLAVAESNEYRQRLNSVYDYRNKLASLSD